MRFMLIVYPMQFQTGCPAPPPDAAQSLARVREFNKSLLKANVLITLYGLFPPEPGTSVTYSGGAASIIRDETATPRQIVGGCWILQLASYEEAIHWATLAPMNDGDIVEVRQVHEATDWPEDILRAVNVLDESKFPD